MEVALVALESFKAAIAINAPVAVHTTVPIATTFGRRPLDWGEDASRLRILL